MELDICFLFLVLVALMSLCNSRRTNKVDSDAIVFLEDGRGRSRVEKRDEKLVPPIEFFQKISNYSVAELLSNYVDGYEDDTILLSRFGGDVERSSSITPKPAICMPELRTVQLINNFDPSTIYVPSCTRLEQCGGCCSHHLLACEPKETETVSFKILKTQFAPGGRLKYGGKEIVHLERHTKCACRCRIKEKDCNTFQEYRANECRCVCTNNDEEKKCYRYNDTKLWDPETCTCRCKEVTECSTGFAFDVNRCKCAPIPQRRRFAEPVDGQKELEPLSQSEVYRYDYEDDP